MSPAVCEPRLQEWLRPARPSPAGSGWGVQEGWDLVPAFTLGILRIVDWPETGQKC